VHEEHLMLITTYHRSLERWRTAGWIKCEFRNGDELHEDRILVHSVVRHKCHG